jgi:hypothetical protein
MKRLLIRLIQAYRYVLSPWIGSQCRFYPTCSHYGEEAIQKHGAIKGGGLTLWRILRCNPWHPGGFDYVPDSDTASDSDCFDHNCNHKKVCGVTPNEF